MIRVVHVVVAGEIGGAERMLRDLAAARPGSDAEEIEHAVALITGEERLVRLFTESGLRVHALRLEREGPLQILWSALGPGDVAFVERVLRAERAAIAHLHTFASQVVGTRAALRVGARVLRTEHSTRVYEDASCWPLSRWSLARADACVSISRHVREVALARAPWAAGKMRVIPNGVDTDRFTSAPARARRAGPFTFALVARLERRKGVDLAIDALVRVPGVLLEIAGEGAERAALERRARRAGVGDRVRFLGYVADTRDVLERADAVLCSSRSEGLGLALLEAMAMGRAVVGFSVGGVSEIVEDGSTGLLAPAGDVEALAARMREAASTAPERLTALGRTAHARVVERFSVRAMRQAYAEVYGQLARIPSEATPKRSEPSSRRSEATSKRAEAPSKRLEATSKRS